MAVVVNRGITGENVKEVCGGEREKKRWMMVLVMAVDGGADWSDEQAKKSGIFWFDGPAQDPKTFNAGPKRAKPPPSRTKCADHRISGGMAESRGLPIHRADMHI